jgi:hypothetical protein
MHWVSAKFVPRLLTDDQTSVQISSQKANEDKHFFKNVITGNEMWVYAYDVQTK